MITNKIEYNKAWIELLFYSRDKKKYSKEIKQLEADIQQYVTEKNKINRLKYQGR